MSSTITERAVSDNEMALFVNDSSLLVFQELVNLIGGAA
jgi:hypothetical protein